MGGSRDFGGAEAPPFRPAKFCGDGSTVETANQMPPGFYLSPTRYLQPSGPMCAEWGVLPGISKRSPGL